MPREDKDRDRIPREPGEQTSHSPAADPDEPDRLDGVADAAMRAAFSIPVEPPAEEQPRFCSVRGILFRLGGLCAPAIEEEEEEDPERQDPSPAPEDSKLLEFQRKYEDCDGNSRRVNRVTALMASSLGLATLSGTTLTDSTLGALGFGLTLTMSGAIKFLANTLLLARSCQLSRPCTHPLQTMIGMGQGFMELFIGLMIVGLDPVASYSVVTAFMIVGSLLLTAEHAFDFIANRDSQPSPSPK